ncbi:MAG: hypothetical protein KDI32_12385 [Pseudomonadales bacterium]|nr:hypothetical protein [Pseudomonadales bacterium]
MKTFNAVLLVLLVYAPARVDAALPPLAELEQRAHASLAMRTLDAALEAEIRRARLNQVGTGARLYGTTGYADSDEIVDESRNRSFGRLSSEVGLRLPVLGSRAAIKDTRLRAELDLEQRAVATELAKRDLIQRLRRAYADHWAAQRLLALSERYREDEPQITAMLQLRTRAGLLLDSDRLDFLASFELARRDAVRAELTSRQALDLIGTLVDGDLGILSGSGAAATRPAIEPRCLQAASDPNWLNTDPELTFLEDRIGALGGISSRGRWRGINSELRVGYQLAHETTTARSGSAAIVAWTFDVPLDYYSGRHLYSAAASADVAHATLERDLRRVELANQLQELIARERELTQSLQFARVRLSATDESMRERTLRARRIAGDVQEQLQSSRLAHYEAAKSVIDAERMQIYWYADWARFEGAECAGARAAPPTAVPESPHAAAVLTTVSNMLPPTAPSSPGSRSLYLWTSEPWLTSTPQSVAEGLEALRAQSIGSLLVSLDAGQIARYSADPSALRAFSQIAARQNMRLELLLGESEWIRPQYRTNLTTIVQQLHDAPFTAIHLDLEPDMLAKDSVQAAALLPDLLSTLRAVRAVTSLPIGLSMHPRYADTLVEGKPFARQLAQLNIEATLMVYVANHARVLEITRPLLARYPELKTRVAVSLEHSLPREASLYHLPPEEQARRMALIEHGLQSPNFVGLTLQPTNPWLASTLLLAAANR